MDLMEDKSHEMEMMVETTLKTSKKYIIMFEIELNVSSREFTVKPKRSRKSRTIGWATDRQSGSVCAARKRLCGRNKGKKETHLAENATNLAQNREKAAPRSESVLCERIRKKNSASIEIQHLRKKLLR